MGLTMSERQTVTRATAVWYGLASRAGKSAVLDESCALTGWHRDHARRALRLALDPRPVVRTGRRRAPVYGDGAVSALRTVWAVLDAPAGKRLAPFLPQIVARLRECGELDLDEDTAATLCRMSAATIEGRLAGDRARLKVRGRSGTKPGSLLKSQIPIRTWADWNEEQPGFVEIEAPRVRWRHRTHGKVERCQCQHRGSIRAGCVSGRSDSWSRPASRSGLPAVSWTSPQVGSCG